MAEDISGGGCGAAAEGDAGLVPGEPEAVQDEGRRDGFVKGETQGAGCYDGEIVLQYKKRKRRSLK